LLLFLRRCHSKRSGNGQNKQHTQERKTLIHQIGLQEFLVSAFALCRRLIGCQSKKQGRIQRETITKTAFHSVIFHRDSYETTIMTRLNFDFDGGKEESL